MHVGHQRQGKILSLIVILVSGASYGILSTVHLDGKAKDCAGQLMEIMRLFSVNHLEVRDAASEDAEPRGRGAEPRGKG